LCGEIQWIDNVLRVCFDDDERQRSEISGSLIYGFFPAAAKEERRINRTRDQTQEASPTTNQDCSQIGGEMKKKPGVGTVETELIISENRVSQGLGWIDNDQSRRD